jgi:predicted AAA+ superfamily ATPase
LERKQILALIKRQLSLFPVVALLGARQVGKTTLARQIATTEGDAGLPVHFFDLEDPTHLARLTDPMLALPPLEGLVVIDEIQLKTDLFPILRVLCDRPNSKTRFLILGSASPDLLRQGAETLAGRIAFIEVSPFGLFESPDLNPMQLWDRGGYPRSILAGSNEASVSWRTEYLKTFLERDIPQLGFSIPALAMRRFWIMLAHYHGQTINYSELGRSLDISDSTVRRYLDILAGAYVVRRVQPWFENIKKRQVKAPKVYIRDSGILHTLLSISDLHALQTNPKLGASWEGFALEEIAKVLGLREEETYFWSIHGQGELDLLLFKGGKRIGVEFKYTSTPAVTKSMNLAIDTLKLDTLKIVHPGAGIWPLSDGITCYGLGELIAEWGESVREVG